MRWTKRIRVVTVLAALAAANAVLAQAGPRTAVVLDAAHGGSEPGALLASGQPEKAYTLALTSRLRALLGARGMTVSYSRDQDTAVDAFHRAELANRANARACLSLHATESGSGVHLFVSALNPADAAPADKLGAWKTAQSAWVTQSLALAGQLNTALQKGGVPVTLSRAPLATIDSMSCPAVALEIAPERNSERKVTTKLDNQAYQNRLLEIVAAALAEWHVEARQP